MGILHSLGVFIRKRGFQEVGNIEAVCPYCNNSLNKKPGRKKKCPHCGNYIYVRTRPKDGKKVLVTKEQIEIIEEQWSVLNGTHAEFLENKRIIEKERKSLAKKFGCEPSENDIRWSLLNKELIIHANNTDWGLYRNAKFEMAEILRKESKPLPALTTYLEVLYLDVNGPNNIGSIRDTDLLKRFSPFDKKNAFLAPGVLSRASKLIQKLKLDDKRVKAIFDEIAKSNFTNLHLPVNPEQGWRKIKKELFA